MKVSELIATLEALRVEHGDLEVGVRNDEAGRADVIGLVRVQAADRESVYPFERDDESLGPVFVLIA